ncbi:MAG: FG-GAP-like repeat-containing protein [Planctomycetota bacterium]|jgi:outer membrane protein assembly factor BamB
MQPARSTLVRSTVILSTLAGFLLPTPDAPAQGSKPPAGRDQKQQQQQQQPTGKLKILWTTLLRSNSYGGAAVADVNKDGKLDVAFGTYFGDGRVLVLNGKDGSEVWSHEFGRACLDASVRFGDVNKDGKLDLVVPVSNQCRVHLFDAKTGKEIWSYGTGRGDCIDSPPAIVDTDGDGNLEVVFGSFQKRLHVVRGDTGKGLRTIAGFNGYVQSGPIVMDVNGDGVKDFIAATFKSDKTFKSDNRLTAIDGKTEKEIWHHQVGGRMGMYHGPSVGDLDGDGKPELVCSAYDGKVTCLRAKDGEEIWSVAPGDRYFMAPTALADVDGDQDLEVVAISQSVTVIEADGKIKYSKRLVARQSFGGAHRGAAIADLDGDGGLDIAYVLDNGLFGVRRGKDGKLLYQLDPKTFYQERIRSNNNGPVLADLNGDGRLDAFFVIGLGTTRGKCHGVAVCVTGFKGRGPGWYMLRHDAQNTGNHTTALSPVLQKHLPKSKRKPKSKQKPKQKPKPKPKRKIFIR